jgi:hypothetical protein
MESGLYVTFFDRDEAHDRELPPVGPLDRVVLRHKQLVAERGSVQQAQELGVAIDRWLEAELELQRATGEEPGGTKRPDLRIAARDGVFVRFAVFGEARERDVVPEAGPFAVVVVGPRSVEGDGQLLASRAASDLAAWEIQTNVGDDFAGLHKPDIAFRATSGTYHPSIAPAPAARTPMAEPPRPTGPAFVPPPRIEPAFTPPPRIEAAPPRVEPAHPPPIEREPLFKPVEREPLFKPAETEPLFKPREQRPVASPPQKVVPPAEDVPALTSSDLELIERMERDRAEDTLRARVQEEERRRLGVDETTDDAATTWAMRYRPQTSDGAASQTDEGAPTGSLLWRLRFVLIGILLVSVGLYTFTAIRGGTAAGINSVQQQFQTVGVGTKVSGTRWEWVVNGVQRLPEAGTARAAGVFYVVRVGATNKGTEGAQLSPSDFTLIDASGVEHTAASLGSGVYQGQSNPGSPNIWPQGFPVGRTTTFNVVFDIDPGLGRGMKLGISDLPRTRMALD